MFESESIKLIPEIREEIIDAINNDQLVLFVGAGVSTIAGLPLWNELARDLIQKCKSNGYINAQQYHLITAKINDAKKLITVSYELFKKNEKEKEFFDIFNEMLSSDCVNKEGKIIFDFIKKSNALVLTTNADKLLDKYFEPQFVYYDLNRKWPDYGPALVKIHGSIDDANSLVFTSSQYLNRYIDPGFQKYLRSIFSSGKTLLFIGYGLGEFELLEYMLKSTGLENSLMKNTYVLNPYFSYEEVVKENLDLYYSSICIEQIAYSRDENDYNQLAYLLEKWFNEIERRTTLQADRLKRIEECLNEKNENCVPIILQLTSESEQAEHYFFAKLIKTSNVQWWVSKLSDTVLFDPKLKIRSAEVLINDDGTKKYSNNGWDGLRIIVDLMETREVDIDFIEIAKMITIRSVKNIIEEPEKANNFHIIYLLCNLIVLFNENVCEEDLFCFLSTCEIEGAKEFLFSASREECLILKWNTDDLDKIVSIMFGVVSKSGVEYSDFQIEEFTKQNHEKISQLVPLTVFNKSIEWLIETEKTDQFSFWQIGAIAKYPEKDVYNSNVGVVIAWVKASIKYISIEYLQQFIIENIKNTGKTIPKLIIYSFAVRFKDLRSVFFELEFNPFSVWNLFADLYYLIELNNSELMQEECDLLYKWITESNYEKNDEQVAYKNAIKYELITLLAKCHIQFGVMSDKYYSKHHDEFADVYELNKGFRIYTRWGPDNDQIIDDMNGKSLAEIIEYLKPVEYMGRHDLYDYQQALMTILEKNEDLIYENIGNYNDLSHEYFASVIRVITKLNNIERIDQTLEIYSMMVENIMKDTANIEALSEIYNSLGDLTLKEKEIFTYFPACNLVLETLKRMENYFLDEYSNIYNNQIHALLNVWFCVGIRYVLISLVHCEDQSLKRKFMEWLNSLLTKESKNINLIKGTLVYYSALINLIDKSWIEDQFDKIFDSIDSTIVFLQTDFWPKEIYPNLVGNGHLKRVLEIDQNNKNEHTEILKTNIASWSLSISIDNNVPPDEVLEKAIKIKSTDILYNLFDIVSSYLKDQNFNKSIVKARLIWLCEKVLNQEIDLEESYDQVLRFLAVCIFEFDEIDDIIWECMDHLAKGFKHFLSDELYAALDKHLEKYPAQIVSIVKNMIENADARAFMLKHDFDKIIYRIKKDLDLKGEFIVINNKFIELGIYKFNDN